MNAPIIMEKYSLIEIIWKIQHKSAEPYTQKHIEIYCDMQ